MKNYRKCVEFFQGHLQKYTFWFSPIVFIWTEQHGWMHILISPRYFFTYRLENHLNLFVEVIWSIVNINFVIKTKTLYFCIFSLKNSESTIKLLHVQTTHMNYCFIYISFRFSWVDCIPLTLLSFYHFLTPCLICWMIVLYTCKWAVVPQTKSKWLYLSKYFSYAIISGIVSLISSTSFTSASLSLPP